MPAAAFFYGTLLHPRILTRVIGNDGAHLDVCPALLLDYTRHQIKHADYPAIVPYAKSREQLFTADLPEDERCVRGTLVRGLTASDIEFLDIFEGDEYSREAVSVHPLAAATPLVRELDAALAPTTPPPAPDRAALAPAVPAQTYVWRQPLGQLRPEVWSFETFVRENAHKWVGAGAQREEYLVLEERRELVGGIVRAVGRSGEVVREET